MSYPLISYVADCVVVSATGAEDVVYAISSVEPSSLTTAFEINSTTGKMMTKY